MSRVLYAEEISKVIHYNFNMEKMTVVPKHAKLSNSDNENKGILALDSILNPLKVNLSPIQDTREIGLVALGQDRSKTRKSLLKENLKFSKTFSPLKKTKILNK